MLLTALTAGMIDGLRAYDPALVEVAPVLAPLAICLSIAVLGLGLGRLGIRAGPALAAVVVIGSVVALPRFSPTSRNRPGPPLVLVTLDTFRADHLGVIGGARHPVETPHLDALANAGTLYTRGIAPAPLTLPSHATLLTASSPVRHGAVDNRSVVGGVPTVAQAFASHGWRTGAFVSSLVLARHTGLARGFDHFDDDLGIRERIGRSLWGKRLLPLLAPTLERPGDRTVEAALAWLESDPGRAFLWIHLNEPHGPYEPPGAWAHHYDATRPDAPGNPSEMTLAKNAHPGWGNLFVPADLRPAVASYAGEISWTDEIVGRLLARLPPDATIVIVADHGESLVEHGDFLGHGSTLYEPALRVPILVAGPNIPQGRVDDVVSLEALGQSLLSFVTGPLSLPQADGVAWSFTFGERSQVRIEQAVGPVFAFYEGPTKWIVDGRGQASCFAFETDGAEDHDIADQDPEASASAEGRAKQLTAELLEARSTPSTVALRTLGYTE